MQTPQRMTPNQALATYALQLVNRSTAPTDDNSQEGLRQVKAWLSSIASGENVVGKPAEAPKPTKKGKK